MKTAKKKSNERFKTRKDERNYKRINKVQECVEGGDLNKAINIVIGMICREITNSRS